MSDFFFLIFVCFFIFVLCSLCGFCCKKEESGAIYSAPVVVTSAVHQPPGGNEYPIHVEQTTITSTMTSQPTSMPMPYPHTGQYSAPYPPTGGAAPYPMNAAPYPPTNSTPYPTATPYGASAPYPVMNQAMINPPSYHEVMGSNVYPAAPQAPPLATDGYQKQSPYNPGYSN